MRVVNYEITNLENSDEHVFITLEKLSEFEKLVARINKNPLTIVPVEYTTEQLLVAMNKEETEFEEVYEITFSDSFSLNYLKDKWMFIGYMEDGIFYKYPKCDVDVPTKLLSAWQNFGNICQHCDYDRKRKRSYLILDTEQNIAQFEEMRKMFLQDNSPNEVVIKAYPEFKIVGSTCIKDFLGDDPTKLLHSIAYLFEETENWFSNRMRQPMYFSLKSYLLHVVMEIKNGGRGYISGKKAYEEVISSTKDIVNNLFFANPAFYKDIFIKLYNCISFPEDIIQYTDKMYAELGDVLQEKYNENPSEFLFNLLSIYNSGVITYKQTGFAAYMPVLYGIDWEQKRKINYKILREDYHITDTMIDLVFVIDKENSHYMETVYNEFDNCMSYKVPGYIVSFNEKLEILLYEYSFLLSEGRKQYQNERDIIDTHNVINIRGKATNNRGYRNIKLVKNIRPSEMEIEL